MINKLTLGTSALIATLMLTACGGGDADAPDTISEYDKVLVMYHYPEDVCLSDDLKTNMQNLDGVENVLLKVESNSVSCTTYGKTNDGLECLEEDLADTTGDSTISTSCVIGLNVSDEYDKIVSQPADAFSEERNILLEASF